MDRILVWLENSWQQSLVTDQGKPFWGKEADERECVYKFWKMFKIMKQIVLEAAGDQPEVSLFTEKQESVPDVQMKHPDPPCTNTAPAVFTLLETTEHTTKQSGQQKPCQEINDMLTRMSRQMTQVQEDDECRQGASSVIPEVEAERRGLSQDGEGADRQ